MSKIPHILIIIRFLLGLIILGCVSFASVNPQFLVVLLTVGLLTDIFDGIIARKMNVSTPLLRRLDSSVDQLFFVCIAISTYLLCQDFFSTHWQALLVLIVSEVIIYAVSFIKFKKEVATHSIGAKVWTLFLFATLVELILTCQSTYLYYIMIGLGVLTRLEIVLILIVLKKWTNDVPTLFHAIRLRKNLPIKRNKLFNG